tara:strand:- start:159 stop:1286 length:1128 start_codon:yes stop_codon:yes gene_type:complete
MPSIGRFLDILEAVSRKDWEAIEGIVKKVAQEERKKKHHQAAHQIEQALDVVMSTAQLSDTIGTVASPLSAASKPPSLLHEVDVSETLRPLLNKGVDSTISEFIGEWKREQELIKKGIEPRKTVLFYGPPGCGKTHLASFIAQQLKMRLYLVRFDSLISSYLGETASNLKIVFEFISSNRCVLLLDELDAIGKLRDDKNELGELKRVVISLLQNLDIGNGRSILISATNHPHMLDPAIWRRFELIIEMTPPSSKARIGIIESNLSTKIPKEIVEDLIQSTEGLTGSDLTQICKNAKRRHLLQGDDSFLPHIFISILDILNRTSGNESDKKLDSQKLIAALALKKIDSKKFSFKTLEGISGIPHSTLHNKSANSMS